MAVAFVALACSTTTYPAENEPYTLFTPKPIYPTEPPKPAENETVVPKTIVPKQDGPAVVIRIQPTGENGSKPKKVPTVRILPEKFTPPMPDPSRPDPKKIRLPDPPMPKAKWHIPPSEYDYFYEGKLAIQYITDQELATICPPKTMACAKRWPDQCTIYLRDDEYYRSRGWPTGLILRHEMGHCNGWPKDHPGLRDYAGR